MLNWTLRLQYAEHSTENSEILGNGCVEYTKNLNLYPKIKKRSKAQENVSIKLE